MNNNTLNVKPVKAPMAATCTTPAGSKPAAGCGCEMPAGKHQGHGQKVVKR